VRDAIGAGFALLSPGLPVECDQSRRRRGALAGEASAGSSVMDRWSRRAIVLAFAALALIEGNLVAQVQTECASVDTAGAPGSHGGERCSISCDSRFVAFESVSQNLVPGGTNGHAQVFVRDRVTGTTELASADSAGVQANGNSASAAISCDGRFVAFTSWASNLVAGYSYNGADCYVRDRQLHTTELITLATNGAQANFNYALNVPGISGDGRYVVFASNATNLVAGDTNGFIDVFVRDRATGTTERVSVAAGGAQANSDCIGPLACSADGRFITFFSVANNLAPGDANGYADIFVRDRVSGTTELVGRSSAGAQANAGCGNATISADGRYVAFESMATNLVPADTNSTNDIFVRDRSSATTERVSVDSTGLQGNGSCTAASISADGRFVAFSSSSSNLVTGDTNQGYDIFLHDRLTGATELVSVDSSGMQTNASSSRPSVSGDGRSVAFDSYASNLVAGDTNSRTDVFVRDRSAQPPSVYCTSGTTSHGCTASITASANPSVSFANPCNITVSNVEGQRFGTVLYGSGLQPIPWPAGGTSWLCLFAASGTLVQLSGGTPGNCDGTLALDWNAYFSSHPSAPGQPWTVGARVRAQAWFRDPPGANSTNLSNAIELTCVP
jgi:Tol biopolymer transport system component